MDCILFDYGNTLVPYGRREAAVVDAAVARAAAEHLAGVEASAFVAPVRRVKDRLIARTRETGRELLPAELADALAEEAGTPSPGGRFSEAIERATASAFESALSLPADTLPVLDALRGRYRLGLVSNYFLAGPLRRTLDAFGIASRMDVIVVSAEVGMVKPRREVFQRALDGLGADPARCVFVGDNLHADVGGAAACGMGTVHIRRWLGDALHCDTLPAEGDVAPDAVVDELGALPDMLRARWGP